MSVLYKFTFDIDTDIVPKMTQSSTFCETSTVTSISFQAANWWPTLVRLVQGSVTTQHVLHAFINSSNEPSQLSQQLCYENSTLNTVLIIIMLLSCGRPITHYASCMSICQSVHLSIPYGLVTQKQKHRKIKICTNIPNCTSGVPIFS